VSGDVGEACTALTTEESARNEADDRIGTPTGALRVPLL